MSPSIVRLRGIPVVCFEGASGFADILHSDQATKSSVIANLDVEAAAAVIVCLAEDHAARGQLGVAIRRLAQSTFDMKEYINRIDELGCEASRIIEQRKRDLRRSTTIFIRHGELHWTDHGDHDA